MKQQQQELGSQESPRNQPSKNVLFLGGGVRSEDIFMSGIFCRTDRPFESDFKKRRLTLGFALLNRRQAAPILNF